MMIIFFGDISILTIVVNCWVYAWFFYRDWFGVLELSKVFLTSIRIVTHLNDDLGVVIDFDMWMLTCEYDQYGYLNRIVQLWFEDFSCGLCKLIVASFLDLFNWSFIYKLTKPTLYLLILLSSVHMGYFYKWLRDSWVTYGNGFYFTWPLFLIFVRVFD